MAKKKLSVLIYFWEGMGECKPSTCQFRLEITKNGYVNYHVGTPSTIRRHLRNLEKWNSVKLPKVSWKGIVGNDDGGSLYKWNQ